MILGTAAFVILGTVAAAPPFVIPGTEIRDSGNPGFVTPGTEIRDSGNQLGRFQADFPFLINVLCNSCEPRNSITLLVTLYNTSRPVDKSNPLPY